jgi:hypothetical protein
MVTARKLLEANSSRMVGPLRASDTEGNDCIFAQSKHSLMRGNFAVGLMHCCNILPRW